jgi:isopenicillin-N epimerase
MAFDIPSSYSPLADHWRLDRNFLYLNHGSFGATPDAVLRKADEFRQRMEEEAVDFYLNHLPGLHQESKNALAVFVGSDPNDLVLVPNTTTGVSQILHSLPSQEGDEWLTTSHAYGACLHALHSLAERRKCKVVAAAVPFPLQSPQQVLDAIEAAITPRTRFALIDHVTSATGLIFPVEEILAILQAKGIRVLVDGAHAPGMLPLHLEALGADFYIGNCHKWICSPKGTALMHVRKDRQAEVHPMIISHYNDMDESGPSHWCNQFFWDGTRDYSNQLCIGTAINQMASLHPEGWEGIRSHNHELVWQAANELASELDFELPAPRSMLGSILTMPMPDGEPAPRRFHAHPPLKDLLFERYRIEVPVFMFPAAPRQWLRISAQLYNHITQYRYLGEALREIYAR